LVLRCWPGLGSQVEKCLLKLAIIVDWAAGWRCSYSPWTLQCPRTFLELVLQDENLCLKKLALAFLTDCVYWFLTSLKSCISLGLFYANAERHRMFLCWSWAVRSGVNQDLYLFLVLHFLNGACLFKMERKAVLKSNQTYQLLAPLV
jgi:hypothetical protein